MIEVNGLTKRYGDVLAVDANFGTPAFAASWDSVSAIERWSEQHREPTDPIVTDARDGRARTLCEYPSWLKYQKGAPDSAGSFVCSR